jgi:DnaJ family protein C protein 17
MTLNETFLKKKLDAKLRLKEAARKARLGKYDVKRKVLVEELEEREREFKKVRLETHWQQQEADNERIKEEGRRLREERQKAISKEVGEREATTVAPTVDTTKDIDAPILG